MINEYHIRSFGWATDEQVARMKELTFKVNDVLKKMFDDAGLILVDYKLEFGVFDGEVLLGDEFSPDGCRLWDKETRQKLDKDRFRQGLGGVVEAYEEVAQRHRGEGCSQRAQRRGAHVRRRDSAVDP